MKLLKNLTEISSIKDIQNCLYKTIILYEYITDKYSNTGTQLDISLSKGNNIPEKVFRYFRYFRNSIVHLDSDSFTITSDLLLKVTSNKYKYDLNVAIRILTKYLKTNSLEDIEI